MKFFTIFFIIIFLFFSVYAENSQFNRLRKSMIETQIHDRGITNQRILSAFLKVKRHLFVKPSLRLGAYDDSQLNIGEGQTISKPYIVAIMTYVIAPDYEKKVLEIGTGSGYQAAILAELVKEVYTIEIKQTLAVKARKLLKITRNKKILLYIGRINSIKGLKQLIDSMKYIKDKKIELKIIGFGEIEKFKNYAKSLNLKNNSILEIWNLNYFKEFRNLLIKPRFNGCKECNFFQSCFSGCPIKPNIIFCSDKNNY